MFTLVDILQIISLKNSTGINMISLSTLTVKIHQYISMNSTLSILIIQYWTNIPEMPFSKALNPKKVQWSCSEACAEQLPGHECVLLYECEHHVPKVKSLALSTTFQK